MIDWNYERSRCWARDKEEPPISQKTLDLVAQLKEMAERLGGVFIIDQKKLRDYDCAQQGSEK